MTNLYQSFDNFSNQLTMYKSVLYGLIGLVLAADVLAFMGVIGISPGGLLLSVAALAASCYVANYVFARLFGASVNSESWLITALILACILNPHLSWSFAALAALCGAVAMASKYLLVWRGSHIFNPAAFGAFVVSVTGLMSAGWWIATPALLPITAGLAVLVLRKQRRFTMFFVFAAVALTVMLVIGLSRDQAAGEIIKNTLFSWPLVFLGSIMLVEPTTSPSDKYSQLLVAGAVGALFSAQLNIWQLSTAPHTVLLIGNILTAVLAAPFGAWLYVTRIKRLTPDILELTFDKPAGLQFIAGQYMEWTLAHPSADMRGNRRAFSIASAPAEDEVRLAVRTFEKGSSFKRALMALKPGDKLRAANVSGQFILPAGNHKLLFIAGGIGITPFRSMVAQLLASGQRRDIALIYLAASEDDFVFRQLFADAEAVGLQTHYVVNKLADGELPKLVPDFAQRHVYISGPHGMVEAYRKSLQSQGVKRRRIHTDHFSGY